MKRKLRDPVDVSDLSYSGYKKEIKNFLDDIDVATEEIEFALAKGDILPWKGSPNEEDQPMLYFGETDKWIKELKSEEKENYSYGKSKIVPTDRGFNVYLATKKGTATNNTPLNQIEKILNTYLPKDVVLEEVSESDLKEIGTAVLEEAAVETSIPEGNIDDSELEELGEGFEKCNKNWAILKKLLKKADSSDERKDLKKKQKKVLVSVNKLCKSWTKHILPYTEELDTKENGVLWAEYYQEWQDYLDDLREDMEEKEEEKEALEERKLEEERLYTKTLEELDQFFEDVEKSKDLDPSVIGADLISLKAQLKSWKSFVGKKESNYEEELSEVEEQVQKVEEEWVIYEPLLKEYNKTTELLQAATETDDTDKIESLTKDLDQVVQQINNI